MKSDAKSDRPSIASFFGFGAKPEESNGNVAESGEPKPERKGWWKKSGG